MSPPAINKYFYEKYHHLILVCGESKKEIEKLIKEGKKDSNKEKKILERLKKHNNKTLKLNLILFVF